MKLQRMLDNGKWVEEDRTEQFITSALALNPDAISVLESGREVKWSKDYWFAKIRVSRQVARTIAAEEWTLCDCGDIVKSSLVMNASRGTSCPDCYDAMSN